ncbi:MAG: hypothetical protein JWP12_2027 [Bacteroidetes bacterium]|nr:hypothetical protein [Bacteroidota bacterium]
MKTVYQTLAILTGFLLCCCDNMTISTGDGANKIKGDGKVTSDVRTISSFHAIDVEGVFNVILQQGDKESVKVETDENIQPIVITEVKNDTLRVKLKEDYSIRNFQKIDVYVTLADITGLKTAGVGTLKCQAPLRLKQLTFTTEGVGTTNLNIIGDELIVKSEIVGALNLSGAVKNVTIHHSGVGMIEAFNLKAENLSLTTDGVGAAEVFASNEININASGIGSVKYKGGALTKNIKSDGVGKVTQAD